VPKPVVYRIMSRWIPAAIAASLAVLAAPSSAGATTFTVKNS